MIAAITKPLCKHCNRNKVQRPRGLCQYCYAWPHIRLLYPPVSKCGNRGLGLAPRPPGVARRATWVETATPEFGRAAPLPAHPTDFLPGTELKKVVMMERAARGEQLFHPQDATYESHPPPIVEDNHE